MNRESPTLDEQYGVGAEHANDAAIDMPSAKVKALKGIHCPHCDCWLEGFVGDPRGEVITCESCNQEFLVEDEVDLS